MNIELQNIEVQRNKFNPILSYTADLVIEGRLVGSISRKKGEAIEYNPSNEEGGALIESGDAYFRAISKDKIPAMKGQNPHSNFETLESYINQVVYDHQEKIVRQEVYENCKTAIAFGDWNDKVITMNLTQPIEDILKWNDGILMLSEIIKDNVIPFLGPGYKILNDNLPQKLMDVVGPKYFLHSQHKANKIRNFSDKTKKGPRR